MPGGQLPFGLAPSGSLTSYTPTLRERATDWLRTKLFTDDRAGQGRAENVMNVAQFTPFGFGVDMYDVGREAGMGNLGAAAGTLAMAGAPGPSPKGIRAYHGSPHDFDKFDMSKIGTGEGAQAYGHGLYFAENEGVARSYRDALSGKQYKFNADPKDIAARYGDGAIDTFYKYEGDPKEIGGVISGLRQAVQRNLAEFGVSDVSQLKPMYDGDLASATINMARNADNMEALVKSGDIVLDPGKMYEVYINADPDTFLDWDKPLFQQSEPVKKALANLGIDASPKGVWKPRQTKGGKWTVDNAYGQPHGKYFTSQAEAEDFAAEMTAQQGSGGGAFAYGQLGGNAAYPGLDKGQASKKLLEAGVPGIKYADAGSRGAVALPQNDVAYNERLLAQTKKMLETEKSPSVIAELKDDIAGIEQRIADAKAEKHLTRNYVVFDDKLISIVRKYGIAGASAMLGYNILDGMDPAQAAELKSIEGNQ